MSDESIITGLLCLLIGGFGSRLLHAWTLRVWQREAEAQRRANEHRTRQGTFPPPVDNAGLNQKLASLASPPITPACVLTPGRASEGWSEAARTLAACAAAEWVEAVEAGQPEGARYITAAYAGSAGGCRAVAVTLALPAEGADYERAADAARGAVLGALAGRAAT